ncbi:MAG: flavodoxin family protein [Anaerovoracaceae bacterium]|jgi:multimeric flavodoxin WrbA
MGKNVLILTGSPRRNGNSSALAASFSGAAERCGHNVKTIDAVELGALGCRGCGACYKTGKPCAFDNPFNDIADDILAADVLVFSMPVYWYTIASQIKAVIDNLYCLYHGKRDELPGKQFVLLCTAGEDEPTIFDGVLFACRRTAALCGWDWFGEVLVGGVYDEGEIGGTDGPEKAEALAEKL